MRILGIETSCDETAAAVVYDGVTVLSSVTATTKEVFADLGGVVPEDAARRQVECILPVLHAALSQAKCTRDDIDAIAITRGPGLLGSLLVGATAARTIASIWKKPIIGVHHTLGHLSSVWLHEPDRECRMPEHCFPVIALSASGGHSDLWYRKSHTKGTLIGQTLDDAAGEAFDKGAAMLGLSYPGGPAIQNASKQGDERAFDFPSPLQGKDTLDFSFSGLKTALKYVIRDLSNRNDSKHPTANLAASFQFSICSHLCDRIVRALQKYPNTKQVHLVGGVSANIRLREMVKEALGDTPLFTPASIAYCTDNAAMIASAGFFMSNELGNAAYEPFETVASLPIAM